MLLHSPPLWMVATVLVLSLVSVALIIAGIVFLARYGSRIPRWLKVAICVAPLAGGAAYPVIGYAATLPFGFLGGLPVILLMGPGYEFGHPINVLVGSLLNVLGFVGVASFFRRTLFPS